MVGVSLSGGGWDGVSGLLAIKAAGGLSIAQDPTEAPYDSMPMHAILDDHVDSILRAAEIGAAIRALASGEPHAPRREAPPSRIAGSPETAS